MWTRLFELFKKSQGHQEKSPDYMKYLVAGLGNIGQEYAHTRHNIGFDIVDFIAREELAKFDDDRYGMIASFKHKSRIFILLKPSTYVNLSGRAVNYWLKKENIPIENLLVISDDIALPFGKLRLKPGGSHAGHNGLRDIQETLGHNQFARLRFGIGDNFRKGGQADFVLSPWDNNEQQSLPTLITTAAEITKSFGSIGVARTMNLFNNR